MSREDVINRLLRQYDRVSEYLNDAEDVIEYRQLQSELHDIEVSLRSYGVLK